MIQSSPSQLLGFLRTHQTVFAICVTTCVTMMGQGVIAPVLPLFAKEFGVGVAMVGFTIAVFGLGRFFTNIPAGLASERYGRRRVMLAGLLIVTVSSLLMALSNSFLELVIYRFTTGIGNAIYLTSAITVLADISTQENRARYMSLQQGSLLLGVGIGPGLGGLAAEFWGFRSAFYLLTVLTAIGLVWIFFRMPETSGTRLTEAAGKAEPQAVFPQPERSSFMSILANMNFLLVSFYFFMIVFTRNGGRGSIVPLLGDAQASIGPGEIGLAFTVMALVNFVMVIPAGWFSDRYGRKALMLPSAVVSAVGLFLYIGTTGFSMFMISSVILGIGAGLAGPSPLAFISDIAPVDRRGSAVGLFRTYGDLGGIVGPIALGWVVDVATFGWALNINIALVLLSGLLVAVFAKEPRRT